MTYEQKKKKLVEGLPCEDGLIIVGVNELHQTLDDMARYVRSVMEVEEKTDPNNLAGDPGKWECSIAGWNSACTTAQKQADDSGIPKND